MRPVTNAPSRASSQLRSGHHAEDIIAKHLLIGWELGAGMGHAHRMVPIASAYLSRGWKVTVAARHVLRVKEALSFLLDQHNCRLSVLQAPIFLHRAPITPRPPVSLAEIFARTGFADARLCRPVIRAWCRLLDAIAPDIVLSDFAPSLNVAVAGNCPLLVIGNGWTIPPKQGLPTFAGRTHDSATREAGDRIVKVLQGASEGRWQGSSFCDLLRGDANFVCTLPQLDPYCPHRTGEHYWPVEIPSADTIQASVRDDVIVYLPGDHPALSLVCAVAERLPWRFHVYAGSADHTPDGHLLFSSQPLNLNALLPSACLAIHHGGLGMANWCLVHRVPQVIFPTDTEKFLVGRGVIGAGAGLMVGTSAAASDTVKNMELLARHALVSPDIKGMQTTSDIDTLTALLRASG